MLEAQIAEATHDSDAQDLRKKLQFFLLALLLVVLSRSSLGPAWFENGSRLQTYLFGLTRNEDLFALPSFPLRGGCVFFFSMIFCFFLADAAAAGTAAVGALLLLLLLLLALTCFQTK